MSQFSNIPMRQSALPEKLSKPIGSAVGGINCGYAPTNTMLIRIRQSFGYPCLSSLLFLPFQESFICATSFRNDIYVRIGMQWRFLYFSLRK